MTKRKIEAKIIADSVDERGNRITSYILTYPRIIHAEVMTHRMFSRNAASSRAIPFAKMVKDIQDDPFIPIAWQKDHKGMQGTEYFTEMYDNDELESWWLGARNKAVDFSKDLNNIGLTKQLCNRLLEPFQWYTCLVTATEFDNFFELRCPNYIFGKNTDNPKIWKSKKDAISYFPDWESRNDLFWNSINSSQAEIHIQALAEAMWDAKNESIPKYLKAGEWHIPFDDKMDAEKVCTHGEALDIRPKIATARCARLSYMTFDGEIDYEKDIKLHNQLLQSKHFSPFEHCARAMSEDEYKTHIKGRIIKRPDSYIDHDYRDEDRYSENVYINYSTQGWCNNFRGFIPYRFLLEK